MAVGDNGSRVRPYTGMRFLWVVGVLLMAGVYSVVGVRVPVAAVDGATAESTVSDASTPNPHPPSDVPVETLRILLSRLTERHAMATSEQAMCGGLTNALVALVQDSVAVREQVARTIGSHDAVGNSDGGGEGAVYDDLRVASAQLTLTMRSNGMVGEADDDGSGGRVAEAFAARVRAADAACVGAAMDLVDDWLQAHPTPSAEATGTEDESSKTILEVLARHFHRLQKDATVASTPVSELHVHEVISLLLPVLEGAIVDIAHDGPVDDGGGEAAADVAHRRATRAAYVQQVFALFGIAQRMIHDHKAKVQVATAMAEELRLVMQDVTTEIEALRQLLSGIGQRGGAAADGSAPSGTEAPAPTSPPSTEDGHFQEAGPADGSGRHEGPEGATAAVAATPPPAPVQVPSDPEMLRKIVEALQAASRGGVGSAQVTVNGVALNIGDPPAAVAAAPPDPSELTRGGSGPVPPDGSSASTPLVDVDWLVRKKVELVATTKHSGSATSVVSSSNKRRLPLPYHSSMKPLEHTTTSAGGTVGGGAGRRPLCSQVFAPSAPDVYPGIFVVTGANILPVTSLVDEALLFVYRDWDAAVDMQLGVLNRSFPEVERYLVPQRVLDGPDSGEAGVEDGDNDDGCVLAMRPGLFSDAYDASFPAAADATTSAADEHPVVQREDPQCSDVGVRGGAAPSWRVARPFVRLAHQGTQRPPPTSAEGDGTSHRPARGGLQAILAVNLGRDGGVVPFLNDVTNPGLYFIQKRTLGPAFAGPWSPAAIRRFAFDCIPHSVVLASHYQLHRVLQTVETAMVLVVRGVVASEDLPTKALSTILMEGASNLRHALGAACGPARCPVHVLAPDTVPDDMPDRWALPLPAAGGDDGTADDGTPIDGTSDGTENPYLIDYAVLASHELRWPHLPRAQWRAATATLQMAERSSTTLAVFRKLKDPTDDAHLGTHAIAALAFPSPTVRTPREGYARQVGGALIAHVHARPNILAQQPYPTLVEDPLSAAAFSRIITTFGPNRRTRRRRDVDDAQHVTDEVDWILLLVNATRSNRRAHADRDGASPLPSVAASHSSLCRAAFRAAALKLRDRSGASAQRATNSPSNSEHGGAAENDAGGIAPSRVVFGIVHHAAQTGFVDELYHAAAALQTAVNSSFLSAEGRREVSAIGEEGGAPTVDPPIPMPHTTTTVRRKRYVSMIGRRGSSSSASSRGASSAVGCTVVAVHVPTGRMERWQHVALQDVPMVPQWLVTQQPWSRGTSGTLLRRAQERWALVTSQAEASKRRDSPPPSSAAARLGAIDEQLGSVGFPDWRLTVAGKRQYPILQRQRQQQQTTGRAARSPSSRAAAAGTTDVERQSQLDMVLLYDARCALSMPAVVGFEQVRRCQELLAAHGTAGGQRRSSNSVDDATSSSSIGSLQHVMKGVTAAAFDVANTTAVPGWVRPLVDGLLGHTDADGRVDVRTPVPMLMVGDASSHTVTLPSSWAWQGYARTFLTVLQAEVRQRQRSSAAPQCGAEDSGRCHEDGGGGSSTARGVVPPAPTYDGEVEAEENVDRGLMDCLWNAHRTDRQPLIRRFRTKRGAAPK